jgi:FimV-like protein
VVSVDNAAPGTQAVSGQSAELDARIASLEDVLAVQREEADRAALLNAELTERLGLLEEQIASAQEIIRLRDLELAQLQESLANAPAEEPVVEEPPTVITMAPERSFLGTLLASLVANTAALLAVTALIISLLVFMLIKRNRAAEQAAALAGMDGLAAELRISENQLKVGVAEEFERGAIAAYESSVRVEPGSLAKAADYNDLQFVDETVLSSLEKPEADKAAVEDDDDVFEYLSDADEAATKLDLARAYFEMGDSDGAREILEEVLREGDEDQVKDARTLLSKL